MNVRYRLQAHDAASQPCVLDTPCAIAPTQCCLLVGRQIALYAQLKISDVKHATPFTHVLRPYLADGHSAQPDYF